MQADVDRTGAAILTTPHYHGPMTIVSFPELRVTREIDEPVDGKWDYVACFVGEHIIAQTLADRERTVAIGQNGSQWELDAGDGCLVRAADSWLTVERSRVRRWVLA